MDVWFGGDCLSSRIRFPERRPLLRMREASCPATGEERISRTRYRVMKYTEAVMVVGAGTTHATVLFKALARFREVNDKSGIL